MSLIMFTWKFIHYYYEEFSLLVNGSWKMAFCLSRNYDSDTFYISYQEEG